jgi:pre-rRNA-processing protein IPI3
MLSEAFLAASLSGSATTTTKDAGGSSGIHIQNIQPPLAAPVSSFKRSSTAPNGVAVSASHVYAAQADRAVVHVYSRDRQYLEATVPFLERVTSVAFCGEEAGAAGGGGAGVLLLGTLSGKLIAWEVRNPPPPLPNFSIFYPFRLY